MTSKLKTDVLETVSGSGTIALTNQLSGMTSASVPLLTEAQMVSGSIVNSYAIASSLTSSTTLSSSSWLSMGFVTSLSVTAGNTLLISISGGFKQASAGHWALNCYLNGVSIGDSNWGMGIYTGSTTITGWTAVTATTKYTIPTTGTYTFDAKMRVNSGSLTIHGDGRTNNGWGYDSPHVIIQEIKG